jgi:tetratricopeptide (TPR) repeat protein
MLEDRWGMFLALNALRQVVDEPLDVITEAIRQAEHLCLAEETALLLCERGDLYRRQGKLEDAHEDYSRALSIGEHADLLESVAAARIGLSRAARGSGNLPAARAHLSAVLALPDLDVAHDEAILELAALNASEASEASA